MSKEHDQYWEDFRVDMEDPGFRRTYQSAEEALAYEYQDYDWPKAEGTRVYETKDSGQHREFAGGGRRDSVAGKPRFDLLFPRTVPYEEQMLTRFAALMARGAEKYASRNWEMFSDQKALEHAEGSLGRHFSQFMSGDTSEDHGAAIMANVMFIEYVKGVLDGRWPALEDK